MPVGIVIVAGERAATILDRGESWLTTHAAKLHVWLSLGFGTALVAEGRYASFSELAGNVTHASAAQQ